MGQLPTVQRGGVAAGRGGTTGARLADAPLVQGPPAAARCWCAFPSVLRLPSNQAYLSASRPACTVVAFPHVWGRWLPPDAPLNPEPIAHSVAVKSLPSIGCINVPVCVIPLLGL